LPSSVIIPLMKIIKNLVISPLAPFRSLIYGKSPYFYYLKAKKELNWYSKFTNNAMINQSYDWYPENKNFLLSTKIKGSPDKSAVNQGILKF